MNRTQSVLTALVLLLASACTAAEPTARSQPTGTPTPAQEDVIRILALGDSLTAGLGVEEAFSYPAQLEAKLRLDGFNVVVINGGISGETSSAALARVEWMLGTQPDIVIVETGGNDALRGIDLAVTTDNLDQIVKRLDEEGIIVIVGGMQIIQNLGPDYADTFAAIYPEIAARYGAVLIPFFLEGVATDPDLNQADFIHPNASGYTVLVENIYPYVMDAIGRLGSTDG